MSFSYCFSVSQNLILNGSFEENIATHINCNTWFNLSENEYDSLMNYSNSIYIATNPNTTHGIDFIDSNCNNFNGNISSQDGFWHLTLSSSKDIGDTLYSQQGITMNLGNSINSNSTYKLSFQSYSFPDYNYENTIKIGLSNNPKSLGNEIYETIPDTSYWQEFTFEFTPESDYQHLSIWVTDNGYGSSITGIDNFILTSLTNTEEKLSNGIKIYPNPFNEQFTVQFADLFRNSSTTEVKLFDVLGNEVKIASTSVHNTEVVINGSQLPKGVYIVDIEGFKKKIIKQ